jgi:hypothetical protein
LTTTIRLSACVAILLLSLAACGGAPAASPSSGASQPPASSGPADPSSAPSTEPSAVPSSSATLAPSALEGTWTIEAGAPRVLSATGHAAGGTATIEGDRLTFESGDYRSEQPIPLVGSATIECGETSCSFDSHPLLGIADQDGQLVVVDMPTLTPVGVFGDACAWEDIPNGGVLEYEWDGSTPPSAFTFAAGIAGGVGDACATGSQVIAWDMIATRTS